MKVVRILIFVFLVPVLAFAQYKIVLKNGKVIEGQYLHEDEANVYIESNGIQMNFKKDRLDIDKMKELNARVPAPEEISAKKSSAAPAGAPKTAIKKPARVYTTEDIKQMREIWNEGKEETAPAEEATAPEPAVPSEVAQTAPSVQSAPTAQTAPVPDAPTAPPVAAQSQPAVPAEPPVSAGPRDEKTIRDEIQTVSVQMAETEKVIQDLRAKGRVTATWEKLVVKQKERITQLQQELKDAIAARKAAQQ